ncbi:unnamed protein product [Oreochromis niloticus]|nr:unnamed protein product [Mustela putorius furo]
MGRGVSSQNGLIECSTDKIIEKLAATVNTHNKTSERKLDHILDKLTAVVSSQNLLFEHKNDNITEQKHSVDKHPPARGKKALTVQSDREKLLGMLEDLKKEELEKFKFFVRDRDVLVELQPIPESQLEKASTCDLVDLMFQTYTERSVEVTKKVLKKIIRNDLVQKLSDSSS